MIMLKCKDLGKDCDFVASGENAYDVKIKTMEHIQMEHKDVVEQMSKMSDGEKKGMMDDMLKNMKSE